MPIKWYFYSYNMKAKKKGKKQNRMEENWRRVGGMVSRVIALNVWINQNNWELKIIWTVMNTITVPVQNGWLVFSWQTRWASGKLNQSFIVSVVHINRDIWNNTVIVFALQWKFKYCLINQLLNVTLCGNEHTYVSMLVILGWHKFIENIEKKELQFALHRVQNNRW